MENEAPKSFGLTPKGRLKGKTGPQRREEARGRRPAMRFYPFLLLSLFSLSIWLFLASSCSQPQPPAQTKSEITTPSTEVAIRSVVKEEVSFFIRQQYTESEWQEKKLAPGEVEKIKAPAGLHIRFQSAWEEKEYLLDPGQAYAFRYDENGQLELFEGSHGRTDAADLAPFVPTPMPVVEKMLELVDLSRDDIVYDLGCGDGRIVVTAAKKYGARGVGIDLDPQRIAESKARAKQEGVTKLVRFEQQDVMKADFSPATVVTLYLLPESNEMLRPLLEKQLKPGTRVVSHNYEIPEWEEKQVAYETVTAEDGTTHTIYVYRR